MNNKDCPYLDGKCGEHAQCVKCRNEADSGGAMPPQKGKGNEMLITGLDEIRAAQTVKFPTSDEVRLHFPQYTKGYVTAIYHHERGAWEFGYCATRQEAIAHYDTLKQLCAAGLTQWFSYSEMYIYSAYGYHKTNWSLLGCMIDD